MPRLLGTSGGGNLKICIHCILPLERIPYLEKEKKFVVEDFCLAVSAFFLFLKLRTTKMKKKSLAHTD